MGNHPFFILNSEMKLQAIVFLISFIFFVLNSCSLSSEEIKTTSTTTDTNYVFDKIPPEDIYQIENPELPKTADTVYIIQIGAFSTMENAKEFADFSRLKIKKDIKVDFNQKNNLYVVQVHPAYSSKQEALIFRDQLTKFDEYKDAWIITKIVTK